MDMNIPEIKNSRPDGWFALRVKSRFERVVSTIARNKGFEEFLPVYRCRRRWSDRNQSVEMPLFPGYIFCRIDPNNRLPLLTVPGAMHFVGLGRVPVAVDDDEIAALQAAVRSGLTLEPLSYLEVGQPVRLDHGPLAGLEGILVEVRKQQRLVVSVTLLKRSVGVEIEREWVTPVGGDKRRSGFCIRQAGNANSILTNASA